MPYSTDDIRNYGDQFIQGGGDYMGLLNLAQQYGVPWQQLASAYDINDGDATRFLNDRGISAAPMANGQIRSSRMGDTNPTFTRPEADRTRGYIDHSIWSGDLGGYTGNDAGINNRIMGEALANGRNLGDLQTLMPQFNEQQITDWYNNNQEGVNAQRDDWLRFNTAGGNTPDDNHPNGVYSGAYNPNWTPGSSPVPQGGNPWLTNQADDIQRRTQMMLGDSFAGVRGQAVGSGGTGGSREGVAQGIAGGRAADFLQGNLANLYSGQYNQDQNRNLQQRGMDLNYNLGNQGQMLNFYNQQRGLDQSGAALGGNLYNLANQNDWFGLNQGSDIFNRTAGGNVTQTNSGGGGDNPWATGISTGVGIYGAGRNWGWW